jgi:hypothetical protein
MRVHVQRNSQADAVAEVRSLRSQIAQKDASPFPVAMLNTLMIQAEIASLSVKLSSAKATVVRATASDNSKVKKSECSALKAGVVLMPSAQSSQESTCKCQCSST